MSTITIERYAENDIPEIIDLIRLSFGHDFSAERWHWLHYKNLLAPSFIILARDDNKIIGIYSVIKKEITINGKKYIAGRDIDPVVHPEYRGKGIFSKLLKAGYEMCKGEIDIHFNFANEQSEAGFLKNGWTQVRNRKLAFPGIQKLNKFLRLLVRLTPVKTPICKIIEIEHPEKFQMNHEFNSDKNICIKKNMEYIIWRYCSNPDKQYRYFKAVSGNDLAIFTGTVDHNKFTLLDILNQSSFTKKQLLKKFVLHFLTTERKKHLVTWGTICTGASSLFPVRKKSRFFVKINNPEIDKAICFKSSHWELGPGESEFR